MTVTIRPAEVADARAVSQAHVAAWQVAYGGIFPARFLDGLSAELEERVQRWQRIVVSPDVPGTVVLVAELDGDVVGWLSCGPTRDDDLGVDERARTGEIYAIYVHPERCRSGAGRALLAEGVARLEEAGFVQATLWVLEDNRSARRFYEHHGWRPDGAMKVFERGGASPIEVRYRRPLAGGAG